MKDQKTEGENANGKSVKFSGWLGNMNIFVDGKEINVIDAIKVMDDEAVDDGIYSPQTVIDMRDALQYVIGRCVAFEKLYLYTQEPPSSGKELDELIHLNGWLKDEA